ncbi:MAG: hypothetical protein JWN21_940 [Sphingomonas bacterium]|uniref:hypothetical protein n=1 Tax=Sphingomonas bacterium TaxID=1895847 RepID=UPI00261D218D|nr:hypothetical protein [Sphingomonas bacterium]MDB5695397.1 hypothetical protein [Sphingomonas bacterium]
MSAYDHPATARILTFLTDIGIPVAAEALGQDTLLSAITVRHGTVVFDPDRLTQPGDLLHEAGHVAVSDPAVRTARAEVADDAGEEMAAIAWSWAAAQAIGIEPRLLFHADGYRGDSDWLIEVFSQGSPLGVPLLVFWGLAEPGCFPAMTRWVR